MDRLGDVLELDRAEIGGLEIEPLLYLPIGVFRETDRAGLRDTLQPGRDIDPITHQVAVGLLHDVAEVDANAELDAAFRRQACVALDEAGLHLDRAAHRIDDAAELDDRPVAGALDGAAVMDSDCGVDQVAPQRTQSRQSSILVCARKPAMPTTSATRIADRSTCRSEERPRSRNLRL